MSVQCRTLFEELKNKTLIDIEDARISQVSQAHSATTAIPSSKLRIQKEFSFTRFHLEKVIQHYCKPCLNSVKEILDAWYSQ